MIKTERLDAFGNKCLRLLSVHWKEFKTNASSRKESAHEHVSNNIRRKMKDVLGACA